MDRAGPAPLRSEVSHRGAGGLTLHAQPDDEPGHEPAAAGDPDPDAGLEAQQLGALESERVLEASRGLDQFDALRICRVMNAEDARVASAVAAVELALARAVDALVERLARGGRLIYAGAGTSGRLGVLDAAECRPTFGTRPEQVLGVIAGGNRALVSAVEGAEDDRGAGRRALLELALRFDDAVCALSASGRTPYALGALDAAREVGALRLCVTCNAGTPLEAAAEIAIAPLVGPEVLAGSTRLKAGTATKLVLNTLTTATFARLGHTLGNRMRNLRATNDKLTERATQILAEHAKLSPQAARELLQRHGGQLGDALRETP